VEKCERLRENEEERERGRRLGKVESWIEEL
jgi:hypothetical protein